MDKIVVSRPTFTPVAKGGGFMEDGEGARGPANDAEADSCGSGGGGDGVEEEDGQEAKE